MPTRQSPIPPGAAVVPGGYFDSSGFHSFSGDSHVGGLGDALNGVGNALGIGDLTKSAPKLGENQYQSQWDQLISQLRDKANGKGPSVAEMQYRKANEDAMHNMLSLSNQRGRGNATAIGRSAGGIESSLAQGSAQARLQEQMQYQQQLQAALAAASGQAQARDLANLQAQMNTPTQFQQLAGIAGQVLGAGAMMQGKTATPQAQGGLSDPTMAMNPFGAAQTPMYSDPTALTNPFQFTPGGGQQSADPYSQRGIDRGYFGGLGGY